MVYLQYVKTDGLSNWSIKKGFFANQIVVDKEKLISHIKLGCQLLLPMKDIYVSDMFINDKRFHWDTH